MTVDRNIGIARRFVEQHNGSDYLAVHDELLADDARLHVAIPGTPDPLDREGHKQLVAMFRAALPDIRSTAEDIIAEGDSVVVRWSGGGTHQGELMGVPGSGRPVKTTGVYIMRLAGGRIVESWLTLDMLGVLQQIGAIPAPAMA